MYKKFKKDFKKAYKIKNFLNLKIIHGIKRKKYLPLKAEVKLIEKSSSDYYWFIISTNQINYLQDYIKFIKQFKAKKFNKHFNLFNIKINYSGSKDFNIKIFGWKVLFEFLKDLSDSSKIIFTDLDFEPNENLKKLLLKSNFDFLHSGKVEDFSRSTGSLFFGKKNKVLRMENLLNEYLKSDLIFDYQDEKILYKCSEKNLYEYIKINMSPNKFNALSDVQYKIERINFEYFK